MEPWVDLVGKRVKMGTLSNKVFENSDLDHLADEVGEVIESNMALHRVKFPNGTKLFFYASELIIVE